jgi:NADP-dependent 3-hydroxy acid dehydrogenase YdfG
VEIADAIVAELVGGGAAPEVGLRVDGTRIEPATVDLTGGTEERELATRIGPDSVIVATGGARGVTAACLRLLAAHRRPKLVLLGRTPLSAEPDGLAEATDEAALTALLGRREPGSPAQVAARARRVLAVREIRATLAAIERDGGTARYVSIDVRDADALSWALSAVRRDWGPITALVHGAGAMAEARIGDKTDEQFGRVFGTKVEGLRALLAATADDPLDVLCAFSSTAAVYGSAGQADAAMAGGVLNQVLAAEQHRRPRCLVRSIAWGPWMVNSAGAGIAADAGARAFLDELDGPADGVLVVRAADEGRAGTEDHAPAEPVAAMAVS